MPKVKPEKPDLLLIEWGDAWGAAGWHNPAQIDQLHEEMRVQSVGFAVKVDRKGVSITEGFDSELNPLGLSFIPKGMIKKIRKIRY